MKKHTLKNLSHVTWRTLCRILIVFVIGITTVTIVYAATSPSLSQAESFAILSSTYTPGVYCISGAASIGGGGTITLNGSGTYIFRMDGALSTSANSVVVLSGGASACDVWWTPTAATTLGADSTFVGTDISAAGITIGSNVTWTRRALAYGGTVTTDADMISTPTCTTSTPTPAASSASSTNSSTGTSVSNPPAVCVSQGVNAQPMIIESKRLSPINQKMNKV